jgi:hypothetical protein
MLIMNANLRVAALAMLPPAMLLSACAQAGPTQAGSSAAGSSAAGSNTAGSSTAGSPSPAPKTSVKPPAAGPTYADVTQGDSSTAAMLYRFDPTAHSAVIEPVIFMEGPSYCKKYRIRSSDERCELDWVLVQSHQKAAVPVSPHVALFTSDSDSEDCIGSIAEGGSCPVTTAEFSSMAAAGKNNFLVHVTIKAGTVTRIAEEYRP